MLGGLLRSYAGGGRGDVDDELANHAEPHGEPRDRDARWAHANTISKLLQLSLTLCGRLCWWRRHSAAINEAMHAFRRTGEHGSADTASCPAALRPMRMPAAVMQATAMVEHMVGASVGGDVIYEDLCGISSRECYEHSDADAPHRTGQLPQLRWSVCQVEGAGDPRRESDMPRGGSERRRDPRRARCREEEATDVEI